MDLIVGIDFGTTNTVISYFENNKPNVLYDGVYRLIPSKIGFKDGNLSFGNYLSLNLDLLVHSFKINNDNVIYDNRVIEYNELLILFFSHIKSIIYKKFNNVKIKSVITVPSNFNDIQREIIKTCFINAGFTVLRIINEPSSAALAYGLLKQKSDEEEKLLVIDMGGGTIDITILLKDEVFFEVIDSVGLNDLGGNNFTDLIYNYVIKECKEIKNLNNLWFQCQNAKEKLSYLDSYEIKIENKTIKLSKHDFIRLCNPLINRLEDLLINIKGKHPDLKYVIMVGNTSKIPILQKIVEDTFKIKPWLYSNLDSVVAEGACLYGAILENKYKTEEDVILVDVLPLSLGVETVDGNFSVIIPKNTPLPAKRTENYTTDSPSESSITIKVYQGERLIANKNTLIGEFIFDKITMGGTPIINITFKVDVNGIITVIVKDKKSNIEKSILIKNIVKLDDIDIEKILVLAEKNNIQDEQEMIMNSRLYTIKTKIEIAMINIKLNTLLIESKREELLKELCDIEYDLDDNVESLNDIKLYNQKLLSILTNLEEKFFCYVNNNNHEKEEDDNTLTNILVMEKKDELYNKINYLLQKNPEWEELLNPILEELTINNISYEYIEDKLNIINDLIEEENEDINYKDQLNNLCLFIKNKIEIGDIDVNNIKKLENIINNTLSLLDKNDNNTNWEIELNNFNKECDTFF